MFFEGRNVVVVGFFVCLFFLAVCLSERYTEVSEVVSRLLCEDYQRKLTTLLEQLHIGMHLTLFPLGSAN